MYERGLASMVYKFFDREISGSGIKNENISNKDLPEEAHKLIIKNFNKRKILSPFIENIWDGNLAGIQLISNFNKGGFYYVLSIFIANMLQLFFWKTKKVLQLLMLFRKFSKNLTESQTKSGLIKAVNFIIDQ